MIGAIGTLLMMLTAPLVGIVAALPLVVLVVSVVPSISLMGALVIQGTRLYPVSAGITPGVLTLAIGCLLLVGTVSRIVRIQSGKFDWLVVTLLSLTSIVIPGFVIQAFNSSLFHLIATANMVLIPFMAGIVVFGAGRRSNFLVIVFTSVTMIVNAVVSIWQARVGTQGLVDSGLQYGTVVRQIDGVLRSPGLMLSNAELGLFAGAVLLMAVLLWPVAVGKLSRFMFVATIISAIMALVLSTSRSGLILFIAGVSAKILFSMVRNRRNNTERRSISAVGKVSIVCLPPVIVYSFIKYGADSSFSLIERFSVWGSLLENRLSLFGTGAGSVGGSSYSNFNPNIPVFVDNAWLSLLIQYGIYGTVVFILVLFLWLFRIYRARDSSRNESKLARENLGSIIFAVLVCGFFTEILDYGLTMTVLGGAIGYYSFHLIQETNSF
ncbi:hypothetical protein [Arthrobacter psychrolactophilus]